RVIRTHLWDPWGKNCNKRWNPKTTSRNKPLAVNLTLRDEISYSSNTSHWHFPIPILFILDIDRSALSQDFNFEPGGVDWAKLHAYI
ncbi:MAG: hypothetical protein PVF14_07875, partial [Desulfobacterales bacterium]